MCFATIAVGASMVEQKTDEETTLEEVKQTLYDYIHAGHEVLDALHLYAGNEPVAGWQARKRQLVMLIGDAEELAQWLVGEVKL